MISVYMYMYIPIAAEAFTLVSTLLDEFTWLVTSLMDLRSLTISDYITNPDKMREMSINGQ